MRTDRALLGLSVPAILALVVYAAGRPLVEEPRQDPARRPAAESATPALAPTRPPRPIELPGAEPGPQRSVHDPTILEADGLFTLIHTGPGLPIRRSADLMRWARPGQVFPDNQLPAWAAQTIEGVKFPWAPDLSRVGGTYRVYYSLSTFGSQRSAIGLVTNTTLDPESDAYRWVDRGLVLESVPGRDPFNAIDPSVVYDDHQEPWMAFGSFYGGIYLARLDRETGHRHPADRRLRRLATRPEAPHAIEAPCLIRRGQHYYLFVSFDFCCQGVESTYRIVVGRSDRVDGPYLDRDGTPMLEGGGTRVLDGDAPDQGPVRGPGHNAVLQRPEGDLLVHHYYDGKASGRPTLQIRELRWTDDGWPEPGPPLTDPVLARPATPPGHRPVGGPGVLP